MVRGILEEERGRGKSERKATEREQLEEPLLPRSRRALLIHLHHSSFYLFLSLSRSDYSFFFLFLPPALLTAPLLSPLTSKFDSRSPVSLTLERDRVVR